MVTTCLPAALPTPMMQARTAWPSRWTVQAPHSAMPHPNLVPVSASSSRRYQSKGVAGSPSKRAIRAVDTQSNHGRGSCARIMARTERCPKRYFSDAMSMTKR